MEEEKGNEHVSCGWKACTKTFEKKEELLPHVSNLHMNSNNLNTLECKWVTCQTQFDSLDELFKHISVNHLLLSKEELSKPNVCLWAQCGERFEDFEALTIHAAKTHIGTGKSFYICEWYNCERKGKQFLQRQKMMRHLQTHTGDKPFTWYSLYLTLVQYVSKNLAIYLRFKITNKFIPGINFINVLK
jgi:uncharacterized Zn-finger protein